MNKGNVVAEKSPFIINQMITTKTKICRYMGFDNFLQMLYGKFFVPRKNKFLDARECGRISMKNRFAFDIVSTNGKEYTEIVSKKQTQIDKYVDNLKQSQYLLTSCWSIDKGEDYLMWESYTDDIGVCVCTTIGDLMDAIDYDKEGYVPICSPMVYGNISERSEFIESVFTKDKFYISENEIRLYFVPKSEFKNIDFKNLTTADIERILLEESLKEAEKEAEKEAQNEKIGATYASNIFFDINPKFIKSVILSPKIKPSTIPSFRKILHSQFNTIFTSDIMIKQSEIQINKS